MSSIIDVVQYSSITILYNPNSTGDSERNAQKFAKKLVRVGYGEKVKIVATKHEGHAEKFTYDIARSEKHPLVISSSGDGGYNEVVNGAIRAIEEGSLVVTGLLPSGNANDHYKEMHKPFVVRQIINGTMQHIDILKISSTIDGKPWQRYAHSYIGFGLSSAICDALNQADLNTSNELVILLKTFVKFQPFTAEFDEKNKDFQSIIVSNVSKMSKVLGLSKKARVDDGLFEVITSEASIAKLIGTIVKSATVGMPHEEQTNCYSFRTTDPLQVQLDGEVFKLDANSAVTITILHKALACVV